MIWNRVYETMSREDLEQLQLERLQATLHRVGRSVTFYRTLFDRLGFSPEDIKEIDGLAGLPFTTKEHIRESYPYGMFAVPLREVVRLHASSGTTGRATVVGYTVNDIAVWTELVARCMTAAGITRDDVVQIAFDYGLNTAAFGLHFGAEKIGASVIPMSTADDLRQLRIMQDYRTTALVSPPSLAYHLAEVARDGGMPIGGLHLRTGLFGSEPWTEERRKAIREGLGIEALDIYGLSEVIGPGVAGECREMSGLHLFGDHFIPEVVDPRTGKRLPEGTEGELVLTTISKEAFPLVRFRTGDITRIWFETCACGRTTYKMARVARRSDDLIIVRGASIYPSQISELLAAIEGANARFKLFIDSRNGLDYLEIMVEIRENLFFDEMRKQRLIVEEIRKAAQERFGFEVQVRLVEPRTMDGELSKGVVEDRRKS
jgi:phenylacetate-CoA ligase